MAIVKSELDGEFFDDKYCIGDFIEWAEKVGWDTDEVNQVIKSALLLSFKRTSHRHKRLQRFLKTAVRHIEEDRDLLAKVRARIKQDKDLLQDAAARQQEYIKADSQIWNGYNTVPGRISCANKNRTSFNAVMRMPGYKEPKIGVFIINQAEGIAYFQLNDDEVIIQLNKKPFPSIIEGEPGDQAWAIIEILEKYGITSIKYER